MSIKKSDQNFFHNVTKTNDGKILESNSEYLIKVCDFTTEDEKRIASGSKRIRTSESHA